MDTNTSISKGSSGAGGRFPVIIDKAQEAIAVLDTCGVVHYANIAWVMMHGYEHRSEVVGKHISVFHNKEQFSADVLPLLQEASFRRRISGPVGHIRKNGVKVPTNTTMVALKDETGRMRGVIVFATDTSELEQLKEEVRAIKGETGKRIAELTSVIELLRQEMREMKHNEVEFLEDIDLDAELVGADTGLDQNQLKQLSNIAKKFASE